MIKSFSFILALMFANTAFAHDGIYFSNCDDQVKVRNDVLNYFETLKIPSQYYETAVDTDGSGFYVYSKQPVNTLYLKFNPEYGITDEKSKGFDESRLVTSKKEIVMALMATGRETSFKGKNCSVNVLSEHVLLRQAIVANASKLEWGWPDGERAEWNTKYWKRGDLINEQRIVDSFENMLSNQQKYSIGCYTAAKMVYGVSFLNFYGKIDANKQMKIKNVLLADHDPLVGIEPEAMWYFEPDNKGKTLSNKGKLLEFNFPVKDSNFVPGDWMYFINTDPISHAKTGYEGSNAIYLGGNLFSDYYNDNNHHYTFQEKIDEISQWKNKVFSRSRHYNRIIPLTTLQKEKAESGFSKGGLLSEGRAVPRLDLFLD